MLFLEPSTVILCVLVMDNAAEFAQKRVAFLIFSSVAGLSLCSGGTPVTASHVIESKAVPVEAVKPTTWNTLSLNEDDTVKERQRDENLTPSQSFEIDDSVAENQSVDDAGGGGLKSLKSLRRRASVYSQGDDGSGKFVARGEVRETKMLRAGSVKNTGVFVNQYAVIKNLGSGSFGKVSSGNISVIGGNHFPKLQITGRYQNTQAVVL